MIPHPFVGPMRSTWFTKIKGSRVLYTHAVFDSLTSVAFDHISVGLRTSTSLTTLFGSIRDDRIPQGAIGSVGKAYERSAASTSEGNTFKFHQPSYDSSNPNNHHFCHIRLSNLVLYESSLCQAMLDEETFVG
jgi:hypothetical protein